jgi:hypothetical protein
MGGDETMNISEIVEYINNSAKEYNDFLNDMARVVNEINNQTTYRIDLEDERPYILFTVRALGIEKRIKKSDLKLMISNNDLSEEDAIIEFIMMLIKND